MSRLVVRLVCCSIVAVVLHVVRLVLSLLCDRYLQAALITIAAAQSTTAATASAATTTSAAQTIAGQCANSTAAGTCATTFSTALQAQTGAGTVSYYNQYCTNYGNYLTCLGSNSTTGAGCPASGTVYSTAAMNCQAVFTSKPLGASCSCAAGASGSATIRRLLCGKNNKRCAGSPFPYCNPDGSARYSNLPPWGSNSNCQVPPGYTGAVPLSPVAIGGITLGSIAFVLLVVALISYLVYSRKRGRSQSNNRAVLQSGAALDMDVNDGVALL